MTFNDIFPQQRKKQRGRRMQKKAAGPEKKPVGFEIKHGGL
ncbi:hypothetical protein HMPREF1981_01705 [Bacteroides pyogenes F0041]|uniref:Uncharacterized protein n=1 Tax=Bacteroides pyogenes F0041 TaxID=1321819 RepID=U2CLL1_9BACE|nr:hypothetical protein HMPREF1981_01705 [Bacteroides pyogenes F0041]